MSRERHARLGPHADVVRVSASTERVARRFAAELGDADVRPTPHGWIVSIATRGERIATLARLAEAARAVVARDDDAELFVLDGNRPIRIPPPL